MTVAETVTVAVTATEVSRRGVLGGVAGMATVTALPSGGRVAAEGHDGRIRPVRLTTEHLANPLGIDVTAPRFGWRLEATGNDRAQTAYQIVVASTRNLLAQGQPDVWDSGRVASSEQSAQTFAGPPLRPRTRYYWTVRVWDEAGRPGRTSGVAWFETAMLSEREWTADWVGSGVVLPKPVRVLGPSRYEQAVLEPGRTLGQSFVSAGPMTGVAVLLSVAKDAPSGCVMTLRRNDPTGAEVGRVELLDLEVDRYGSAQGRLDFPAPVESGAYYLELSAPRGSVSWSSVGYDAYPDGTAYADGEPVAGDRWLFGLPPDPPADPLLRTEFDLGARVRSARLYVAGLGLAVPFVNGHRVGDDVLTPKTTDYDRRLLYATYDVTALLRPGGNALGLALGRGFFSSRSPDSDGTNLARWVAEPQARAQLEVTLADGHRVTVGTGQQWRLAEGPTTYDAVYAGESYDARRAERLDGWAAPGFDAEDWRPAAVVKSPGGRLEAFAGDPVRTQRPVRPVEVTRPADGVRVYDFGVVLSGWARLRGRLPEGARVGLQFGEKLRPDGRVEVGLAGGADNPSVDGRYQRDEYTASGRGVETWQASFTYKGFRYVEVTGTTQPVDLVAVPVWSDVADTMHIALDHPVLQWIADAFRQTALNGLHGHPDIAATGKMGWTGAAFRAHQPMLYQFAMAGVFATWLEDLRLAQAPDGEIPLIAPQGETTGGMLLTPTSTGVYPSLVRRYWLTYGDRTVPERHFDAVRRYVGWLLGKLQDDISDDQFGDWYPPGVALGENPQAPEGGKLVATAFVIQSVRDATALADLLGHDDLAGTWRARALEITARFNEEFLDTGAGVYRTDVETAYRQTSNAVPLAFGLVPAAQVAAVARGLAADVEAKDRHLDTGAVGTGVLPYALSDHGRADLAHAVLGQRTYPSYGYLRGLGATTFWESWEATSRGNNDSTLSEPVRWLVERVLGVEVLAPGWRRFRIAPRAFADLPRASVALDTVRGRIEVAWRREGSAVVMDLRVPVNATAEVILPDGRQRELGSGRYRIEAPLR